MTPGHRVAAKMTINITGNAMLYFALTKKHLNSTAAALQEAFFYLGGMGDGFGVCSFNKQYGGVQMNDCEFILGMI
jgi:hypothetical protein